MKKLITIAVFFLITSFAFSSSSITNIPLGQVQQVLKKPISPHPRLFLSDQQLPAVMQKIKATEELRVLHEEIIKKANGLLKEAPLERKKTGVRLLRVSITAFTRLLNLGWAYRATGDEIYLERAEKEMLALAAFSDWNSSHFLDVAEMTTAMAIGYDWFYEGLSAGSRDTIRRAIIEKGIRPSFSKIRRHTWWINKSSNWNQICHGGMTCGALAVIEDEPQLAEAIIHRSVNKIQIAMGEYEPHGAYPEGPSYWTYGTNYNVLLLAALESALGTDFGLSEKNGFAKSAEYFLHVTGPTGLFFNYPDSGSRASLVAAVSWFAGKYKNPMLMWYQQKIWEKTMQQKKSNLAGFRMSVLALIWTSPKAVKPEALSWMGQGTNPVAMFRSSWDNDATYLAIKGGTPDCSHGHMDVGSFVMDAQGQRWAMDLGSEKYQKFESLGMGLWDYRQTGDRWKIFRHNNFSHNTLVVDNQLQLAKGYAPIVRYSAAKEFPHAAVDITNVYSGQLSKAVRGASILPSGQVLIQDEIQATDKVTTVRWAMVTGAKVKILSNKTAILSQNSKHLQFQVISDADLQLETFSTKPRADYDKENPNTQMIGFNVKLKANENAVIRVVMTPGSDAKPFKPVLNSVENWSKPIE